MNKKERFMDKNNVLWTKGIFYGQKECIINEKACFKDNIKQSECFVVKKNVLWT